MDERAAVDLMRQLDGFRTEFGFALVLDAVARIEALPIEDRHELIRESLVATWNQAGLREWVRERQRQAAAAPNPYAPDEDDRGDDR